MKKFFVVLAAFAVLGVGSAVAGESYCPIHEVYYTGECPTCKSCGTLSKTLDKKAPVDATQDEKNAIKERNQKQRESYAKQCIDPFKKDK